MAQNKNNPQPQYSPQPRKAKHLRLNQGITIEGQTYQSIDIERQKGWELTVTPLGVKVSASPNEYLIPYSTIQFIQTVPNANES